MYVYEAFTVPQLRGQSIFSWCSCEMEKYFLANGYKRLLAAVGPENHAGFRSIEKGGYAVVGRMGYRGFGRFRRYFCHYQANDPPISLQATP